MTDRFLRVPGKTRINVKIVDEAQHRTTDINFPGQTVGAGRAGQPARRDPAS